MFDPQSELIPFFLALTILTALFLFFFVFSLIQWKKGNIRREKERLQALNEERERVMTAISVEIHDNVNQMLTLGNFTLSRLETYALPPQTEHILTLREIIGGSIKELRGISHALNSEYLKEKGLFQSLLENVERINQSRELHATLDVTGAPHSFDPDTELILLRMAQELIQNTLKHAHAKNLDICMAFEPSVFKLIIKDDGQGFDLATNKHIESVGFKSLRNRAAAIRSKMNIWSETGKGTEVTLTLPKPKYKFLEPDEELIT